MTEKKTIQEYNTLMYGDCEVFTIDYLITILNTCKDKGYTEVILEKDSERYDEGDTPKLQAVRYREETDAEYLGRTKLEDIRVKRAEADLRRQYEKLHKQFGNNETK